MARTLLAFISIFLSVSFISGAKLKEDVKPNVLAVTSEMIKDNAEHWTHDYAVMFYAPWCPHCRRFTATWEYIAAERAKSDPKGKSGLVVSAFNCEASTIAHKFCESVGVTHYPTIMMFGYGPFHDRSWWLTLFRKTPAHLDKSVKFRGPIYYDSVLSWIKTMSAISRFYRVQDRVLGLLGFSNRDPTPIIRTLKEENRALKEQNKYLVDVTKEAYELNGSDILKKEDFDATIPTGDPFLELHTAHYDPSYLPLLSCVVDASEEYCDVIDDLNEEAKADELQYEEPYCEILDDCILTGFDTIACRPKSCPLSEQGCAYVARCLDADLLQQYIDIYADAAKLEQEEQKDSGSKTNSEKAIEKAVEKPSEKEQKEDNSPEKLLLDGEMDKDLLEKIQKYAEDVREVEQYKKDHEKYAEHIKEKRSGNANANIDTPKSDKGIGGVKKISSGDSTKQEGGVGEKQESKRKKAHA